MSRILLCSGQRCWIVLGFVSQMNALPVRPQGIIVWDLEGQEFIHPTTYIGDPRALGAGYAPEMNAIADELLEHSVQLAIA